MEIKEILDTVYEVIMNDWTKALGSAWFGFYLSGRDSKKKIKKLHETLYVELKYIQDRLKNYLVIVINDIEESPNDVGMVRPSKSLDFSILNQIILEIYKSEKTLKPEQRKLIKNLEQHVEDTFNKESSRLNKVSDGVYRVNTVRSIYIAFNLVQAIYYIQKFIDKKGKFSFDDGSNIEEKIHSVFDICRLEKAVMSKNLMLNELKNIAVDI
ncbi:hypothetical protein RV040_004927 [Vibrio alginolyticus]|uniref:hypothetical protein n=1 Tax=Vibrio harveyi group TaxID=717610 RepID=UPI001A226210|nr:hypothetical protein [Vibrio parahaemolyticus]EGQ9113668.1 hypothetical protein [Vibrio alginolyticus]ELK8501339.1 hypothetical protein [Vibrio alginolyticus]HAS6433425.1 hypothetical protein [Vibrio parahaemolyticus]HAS6852743.1 hypothetical protein [Vibrio parahaemolyticus]HAS6960202.1 hypothetical protein [Vibrio parahaemolyticus]